jgi:hypothetical protein
MYLKLPENILLSETHNNSEGNIIATTVNCFCETDLPSILKEL